ncbi:hypothetical protein H109_04705 [Trichophyton interdigitale MR816]|uniref:Uncharacterized protein n=1 Tax=Trichophyton interdigitale (strain MR816) TaxID=1215338 RepID=A0A059J6E9_TRIIM|nr:hypothetical protein H101_04950 [Trichophyton interdigitale H6]KDB23420.1 hypothetical protein H109_04705 [Trichophyton interdigitale MR816]
MAQTEEPWLTKLHDEWISSNGSEEGVVEHDFAIIIKDLLLGKFSPVDAAKIIDTYYWDRNLDSGPLFKYHPEGVGGVEAALYEIILDAAQLLSYKDPRQDTLAQVVLELHRIPPKPTKRWNGDLFVTDSLFSESLSNRWRDTYTHEISTDTMKEIWISLSSFIARCIELRIESHVPDGHRYPLIDISKGLEENLAPGLERDTRVMVAAQYILLAPTLVSDKMSKLSGGHDKPSGCDILRLWIGKLEELTEHGSLNPEVKAAVVEAKDKLVSLHQKLVMGGTEEV